MLAHVANAIIVVLVKWDVVVIVIITTTNMLQNDAVTHVLLRLLAARQNHQLVYLARLVSHAKNHLGHAIKNVIKRNLVKQNIILDVNVNHVHKNNIMKF
jgi:hypothetical protein